MIAAGRTIAPGEAFRTLLYLDSHILVNRIRTVLRNPVRLILWLAFAAVMLSTISGRMMINEAIRSRPQPTPGPFFFDGAAVLHVASTFLPGITLIVLGLFTVIACRQPLGSFRSAADARFLCGSALPPRVVVLWLTIRVILSLSWRLPLTLAFFLLVLPTSLGVSGSTGLIALLGLSLLGGMVVGMSLPIFIARQRRLGPNPAIAGWVLAAIGIAATAVAFVGLSPGSPILPSSMQAIAGSLPPGSWLVGAFEGNALAPAGLAVLAAAAVALTALIGGDVYPELWQASARVIVLRRAMRRRGVFMTSGDRRRLLTEAGVPGATGNGRTPVVSSRGRLVPPGAWTVLWKEWLATRRMAGGLRMPVTGLVLAILLGVAVGLLSRNSRDVAFALLAPMGYLLVLASFFTAFHLSADFRKPIWWLSASSLRFRLSVLLVARSLRVAIPIVAGLLAATVVSGSPTFVLVGGPIAFAVIWALNAMGLATYALIPGSADMRGPGGCLRGVAVLMMLIPIAFASVAGGIVTESGSGSLAAAVGTALGEGWLLILLAASQLDGNGFAFAQAERR
ncbi:MAG TPA: putative ABC exporter domain-containing protein [Candidatus Limnocylindrales bacterium]|nr:putative ABC exporter domain-containing protein [Candidatus Limnocylindrales bacterium]